MKITVTQEDISNGLRLDANCCPVALAIKRKTGDEMVSVLRDRTNIWQPNEELITGRLLKARFHNSAPLASFIARFDKGKPVRPASFVLKEVYACAS